MDTESFIVYMKTEGIHTDNVNDVETRFDTSNYKLGRLPQQRKNKKVIGFIKYKFGGKIMTEFAALRTKTQSYLTDNNDEDKKSQG